MAAELPPDVDYRRLLAAGGTLAGSIAATRLTRVGGNFRVAGATTVQLQVHRDERGRVVVEGEFVASLEAQCQRCLEWMRHEVRGRFACIVVDADLAAPALDADEDYVEAGGGRLPLLTLVEDELLLACPMIPVHAEASCAGGAVPAAATTSHKPFAGLGTLLKTARAQDD